MSSIALKAVDGNVELHLRFESDGFVVQVYSSGNQVVSSGNQVVSSEPSSISGPCPKSSPQERRMPSLDPAEDATSKSCRRFRSRITVFRWVL